MRPRFLFLLLAVMCLSFTGRAAETNVLTWDTTADEVSADLHHEQLFPLLQAIAHQTGWHVFVEPEADRNVSVTFHHASSGDALHKLLGNLNFALVPKTDEPWQLYVFTTRMENATRPVLAAQKPVAAKQKHVPNQLLVKLKPGANIDALAKAIGAKVVDRNDKLGLYLLEFPDATSTDAAMAQLQNNSDVQSVDYNYVFDPPTTPQLYAGNPVKQPSLALNPSTSSDASSPIIGLIDTQIQLSGATMSQFALPPISVAGSNCPPPVSITHATAMYETILTAIAQVSGGHSSVKILPVNVFDCDGTANTWNVMLGMQAAFNNGARVFSMSLGGTGYSSAMADMVNQLEGQGVVIFAAAGNQPVNTPTYPAAYPGVIAVTALGAPGKLASYANFGSFVDVALPGASIVSLNSQSYVVQGTSPATAYATGVAVATKEAKCQAWTQIETGMEQQFPVPPGP